MTTKNTPITAPQLASFTARKVTGLADTLHDAEKIVSTSIASSRSSARVTATMGSPHETDNIVRFGRDAERCSKEGVENRQSRVYPIPMSASPVSERQSRVVSFVS